MTLGHINNQYVGVPIMTTKNPLTTPEKDSIVTKEVKTAKGNVYNIPTKYADLPTISAMIRAMVADGWKKYELSKVTGIRYQMVRNILLQAPKK